MILTKPSVRRSVYSLSWLFCAACAGTPGAEPHDMSATQHEAMASQEESAAAAHAKQYDAHASDTREKCKYQGRGPRERATAVCWTSETNPTDEHRKDAADHQKRASDHRAASKVLVDAETAACAGISDQDRDTSPFFHREDIASVAPLFSITAGTSRGPQTRVLRGATVTFRATPGLTEEWLQRIVDCHIARNGAVGHEMPEMPYCPLVPGGVSAAVRSTGDGFAVVMQTDNPASAAEVLKRAQSLVAH